MTDLLLGTSGWSYNEWNGVFYPSSSINKLSYYSKLYATVEIDSTFYAYPSKGMVLGWAYLLSAVTVPTIEAEASVTYLSNKFPGIGLIPPHSTILS
ncbi:MAG: DUF72 domain-containing protein, partial [Nitrososphaerota archaeon]|nr:DUF72 domain-containing protein [Nitrososphaerota archaeon]